MSRRILLIVLAVLGAIPVGTGLIEVALGPAFAPGGEVVNASVDSEYRFAHVIWIAVGVILWWTLRAPAERAAVTRTLLVVVALGDLGRLISVAWVGWPHPVFIAALVLELVILPLVLWWHWRVFPPERTAAAAAS